MQVNNIITVDGETLEFPEGNLNPEDVMRASGLTQPHRYDLYRVEPLGALIPIPGSFTPTPGGGYITARKSTSTA